MPSIPTLKQTGPKTLILDFGQSLKANAAALSVTSYALSNSSLGIVSAVPLSVNLFAPQALFRSVLIRSKHDLPEGVTTVTVDTTDFETADGGAVSAITALAATPIWRGRRFFIEVQGVPGYWPGSGPTYPSGFSEVWRPAGHSGLPTIPHEHFTDISAIGNRLEFAEGRTRPATVSLRLFDFNGRLASLFATAPTSGVTMTLVDPAVAGSARRYEKWEGGAQTLYFVEDKAGEAFADTAGGVLMFAGLQAFRLMNRNPEGSIDGHAVYSYTAQPVEELTGHAWGIRHTIEYGHRVSDFVPFFEKRQARLYEVDDRVDGGTPKLIFHGVLDEPVEAGPQQWEVKIAGIDRLWLDQDLDNVFGAAESEPLVRLNDDGTGTVSLRFRRARARTEGNGTWSFRTDDWRETATDENDSGAEFEPESIEIPALTTLANVANLINRVVANRQIPDNPLDARHDGFPVSFFAFRDPGQSGVLQPKDAVLDTEFFASYQAFVPCVGYEDGGSRVLTDGEQETARILQGLGWGGLVEDIRKRADANQSGWQTARAPGTWLAGDFEVGEPILSLVEDGNRIKIAFRSDRDETDASLAQDDLPFWSTRRGWDPFSQIRTKKATGGFPHAKDNYDAAASSLGIAGHVTHLQCGEAVLAVPQLRDGPSELGGFAREDLDSSGVYRDTALCWRIKGEKVDLSEPVRECVRVSYPGDTAERDDVTSANLRQDLYWSRYHHPLQAFARLVMSTGADVNGADWDRLPGAFCLGYGDVDTDALAQEIGATPGVFCDGFITADDGTLWEAICKRLLLPIGYFAVVGLDGSIRPRRIEPLAVHESPTYTLTTANVASAVQAERVHKRPFNRVKLAHETVDGRRYRETAVFERQLLRSADAATLEIDSLVFPNESARAALASGLLPFLQSPTLRIRVKIAEVQDANGNDWRDIDPGEVIRVSSLPTPNPFGQLTVTGDYYVFGTNYHPKTGVVELDIAHLAFRTEDARRGGYGISLRVVDLDTTNHYVWVARDADLHSAESVAKETPDGLSLNTDNLVCEQAGYDQRTSQNHTPTASQQATRKSTACWRLDFASAPGGDWQNWFWRINSAASSVLFTVSGDARGFIRPGMKVHSNDANALSGGHTVESVVYLAGTTTITLSDAMLGTPTVGSFLWPVETYLIADEWANARAAQQLRAFYASGEWRITNRRWVRPPYVSKVGSDSENAFHYA